MASGRRGRRSEKALMGWVEDARESQLLFFFFLWFLFFAGFILPKSFRKRTERTESVPPQHHSQVLRSPPFAGQTGGTAASEVNVFRFDSWTLKLLDLNGAAQAREPGEEAERGGEEAEAGRLEKVELFGFGLQELQMTMGVNSTNSNRT